MTRVQHNGGGPAATPVAPDSTSFWGDDPGDLYRAHVRDVHRFFALRVGDDLAEELTAQTFVEAWAERSTFDPERGSPRRWIFGIANHVLYHHYRQERRRAAAHMALSAQRRLASLADAFEDEVCEALAAAERMTRVDMALSLTEPADREMLVLGAQPDVSYQVLAEEMDIPVGTVRSRLSRARRRLATQIEAEPLS